MLATLDIADTCTPAQLPSLPATVALLESAGNYDPEEAYVEALRIHREGDLAAFRAAINSTDD